MKSHLPKAPVLESFRGSIEAAHYNRVRLALTHLGAPQDAMLGSRGLGFLFHRDLWLCRDERLDGAPLVTWSGFERTAALHAPVRCQIAFYHPYARTVAPVVLAEVAQRLASRLREEREYAEGPSAHVVVKMPDQRTDRQ